MSTTKVMLKMLRDRHNQSIRNLLENVKNCVREIKVAIVFHTIQTGRIVGCCRIRRWTITSCLATHPDQNTVQVNFFKFMNNLIFIQYLITIYSMTFSNAIQLTLYRVQDTTHLTRYWEVQISIHS